MGDIARLHSAVIAYARDFMIDRGFTYVIPPYMIRSDVVTGVMSFAEMDSMMYKIEGEDLYLVGTSEHSMIGKFIDQILPEAELPLTLTSYSPCFRKEKGAHGIEERGVYRIHQFEKQEMIVVCKPEDSKMWFDKLWQNTVDLFRSLDIPVRTFGQAYLVIGHRLDHHRIIRHSLLVLFPTHHLVIRRADQRVSKSLRCLNHPDMRPFRRHRGKSVRIRQLDRIL